jgi:Domain of unknown function (DUF4864)
MDTSRMRHGLFVSLFMNICCAALIAAGPTTQESKMSPTPSPAYTPDQVVRIQLDALHHNDDPKPDAGIATVFKFASPENKEKTGPLEKFAQMVKGPEYSPMINHKSSDVGNVHVEDDQARQLVKITGPDDSVALFVFILRKQSDGPYKDCWMTDGVVRVRPEDIVPAPTPQPGDNGDGHDRT